MTSTYLTCDVYVHPLIIGWVIGGNYKNLQRIMRESNTAIQLSSRAGHTLEVSGWAPCVTDAIYQIKRCEQHGMRAYHPHIAYAPEPHQIISMAENAGFQSSSPALAPTSWELSVFLTPPPPPEPPVESTSADAPANQKPPERLPSIIPPTSHSEGPPEVSGKSEQFASSSGLAQRPVKREANDDPASIGAAVPPPFAVKEELEQSCETLSAQSLKDLLDVVDRDASSNGRAVKEDPSAYECSQAGADNRVHPSTSAKDVGPQQEEAGEDQHGVLWFDANGVKLHAWTEADGTRFTVVTAEGRFYYYYSVSTKNGGKRYQCRFCRRNANIEEGQVNGQPAWRFSGDFVSNHRQDTKCVHAAENPWSNIARKSALCPPAMPPLHSADKPNKRLSSEAQSCPAPKQMRLDEGDASDPAAQLARKSFTEWQHKETERATDLSAPRAADENVAEVAHALQSAPDDSVATLHDVSLKSFERKTALAKYVVDTLCEAEGDKPRLVELMHSILIYKVPLEDAADDVPTRLALKTYKKICASAQPIVDERISQILRAVRSDPAAVTVDDVLSGEVFDMVAAYTSELWQKARLPISAAFVESLLRVLLRCRRLDTSGRTGPDVAELIRQRALQCVRADDD